MSTDRTLLVAPLVAACLLALPAATPERSDAPDAMSEAQGPRPIDPALFAARGHTLRPFVVEETIAAATARVFAAWTDAAAFKQAYDPEREALRADIDLAIGGRYEWLWDGVVGSNGCQVLSYVPDRMLSFSWNAPPSQPESRAQHTWVVVELDALDESATRVRLTHLGFGPEAHWDETRDYFAQAWPHVLATFKRGLER